MTSSTDVQQHMIDALIEAALTGDAPWQKPWDGQAIMPTHVATGRTYQGANLMWLWLQQTLRDTVDGRWMTAKQAATAGYAIREGARSITITVLSQYVPKEERKRALEDGRAPRTARHFGTGAVFHASDIDGLPALERKPAGSDTAVPEVLERLLSATGATVRHQAGDAAFHVPGLDVIVLPLRDQFANVAGYTATALHELAHWTGGADRLARTQDTTFGSTLYAREELVAEMAATLTAARLGISTAGIDNAGAYLRSWTRRTDPAARRKLLVKASRMAVQAADMLAGLAMAPRVDVAA